MNFQAVIFDMDGVLIDSESKYAVSIDNMLAEYGISITREQRLAFIGAGMMKIAGWLKEWDPNFRYTTEQFRDMFNGALLEGVNQVNSLMDGLDEWLPGLQKKGIKMALASSGPKAIVDSVVEKYGLSVYMDAVLSVADIKEAKPAPEIFLKAAALIGVEPGNCLVIEDSQNGINAAKAAGMTCAAFTGAPRLFDSVEGEAFIISAFDRSTFDKLFGAL